MTGAEKCEPAEMSARGYCPGEEGHQAEIDGLHEDLVTTEPTEASCELDGSCDDSCTPPARGDCTLETPTETTTEVATEPPSLAELPATGGEVVVLGSLALGVAVLGALLRGVRRSG